MSKYRDNVEITAAILEISVSNSSKTRIMARANLSYKLLNKYLELTLDSGFIFFNGYTYQTTKSGQEFLSKYRLFNERFNKIQCSLAEINREHKALQSMCSKPESVNNIKLQ
jgi:predicted transcriptional regulator